MPKMDAMMPTSSDLFPIQLAFCFCLFGFFGTIISTTVFLKWQTQRSGDDHDQDEDGHSHSDMIHPTSQPHKPQPMQTHFYQSQSNRNTFAAHHHMYNPQANQYLPQHTPQLSHYHTVPTASHTPLPVCARTNPAYHRSYLLLPHTHYQPNPHHQMHGIRNTQIILDWDDTLFPTAYTLLNMKNGTTNSKYIDDCSWRQLEALTNTVLRLLITFVNLFGANNVCIVTNAKLSWWNDSCLLYKQLFSNIRKLVVNTYNIKVISAYDLYKRKKTSAFMDVLSNKHNISQVICIGDSNDEYEAIDSVCSVLRIAGKKSINYYRFKLLEMPSLDAMIRQLESIKKLDYYAISKQRHDQSYTFK
eukprot:118287_1